MKRYGALLIGCLLLAGCGKAPAESLSPVSETAVSVPSLSQTEQTERTEQTEAVTQAASEMSEAVSEESVSEETVSTTSNEFLENLNEQMAYFRQDTENVSDDSSETTLSTGSEDDEESIACSADIQNGEKRGDPAYGYVTVPADWVQAEQDPEIAIPYLEYDDPEGTCEIVMFSRENYYSRMAADDIYDDYESRENYSIIGSIRTNVCGCTAYRIDVHLDDKDRTAVVWVFEDEDLLTHFLNIECPDEKVDDMLRIASTYSFT
ncbi:MAG: hypothetical protein J6F31_04035 [Oscillospiraceae bacterium]|nr:hypothetical protein [Oscillospiraceae bacterium]